MGYKVGIKKMIFCPPLDISQMTVNITIRGVRQDQEEKTADRASFYSLEDFEESNN